MATILNGLTADESERYSEFLKKSNASDMFIGEHEYRGEWVDSTNEWLFNSDAEVDEYKLLDEKRKNDFMKQF